VVVKTLLIVAGEASGDLHGANLARELLRLRPGLRLAGAGGARMRDAGVEILHDPTAHASIGVVEALRNLGGYAKMHRALVSALRARRPDGAVLIDCPDFNLRYAERVRDAGVPVVYYISPQVWAWRPGRVRTIRRLVRRMIVIFDFEERFYRDAGVDAVFVGHPLLDAVRDVDGAAFRREIGGGDPLVGLLPGSRWRQFKSLLPLMLETGALARRELPGARFVVGCADTIAPARVAPFRRAAPAPFEPVWGRTAEVMAASDLLLVASGTATLEAAIYGTPMIVTYKMSRVAEFAMRPFVAKGLRFVALPNIIAGREIVPELYQAKAKPGLLAREAVSMVRDGRLASIRRELAGVRAKLGRPGASRRAAEEVLRAIEG
jgi:lipid-A-disaccharide synthase